MVTRTPIAVPTSENIEASPPTANAATPAALPIPMKAAPTATTPATISATFLTTSWFLPIHSIRPERAREIAFIILVTERSSDSPIAMATPSIELFRIRNAPPIPASISRAVLSAMPFDFFRSASSFLVSVTVFPMAEALVMPIKPKTSLKAWARSPLPMLADAAATSPRMSTRSRAFPWASLVATPNTF